MSEEPINQLMGDTKIISQILTIATCLNCQKQSLHNQHYQQACHHGMYCPQCISYCATCSKVIGSRSPILDSLLQKVSIKCKYSKYGCQAVVAFSSAQSHEINCSFSHSSLESYAFTPPKKESTSDIFPNMKFVNQDSKQCEPESDGSLLMLSNVMIKK